MLCILLVSCNTNSSANTKIKKTVISFLNGIEKGNTNQCRDLIHNGHEYYGSIHMQVHFLNKNYKKINSYIDLKKNINIKDTVYSGAKMKYVQYDIKNDDPKKDRKPLIITFIFYNEVGYDKIFNSFFVENILEWQ